MNRTRSAVFLLLVLLLLGQGCRFAPSPADQAKIDTLQVELQVVTASVVAADQENSTLSGGLVKGLVEARREVLETTKALLQQRIQALESGARITISVTGSQPDQKLAESLERDIQTQEDQLKAARADAAQYSGGLVYAMKEAAVASQEESLAMLKSRYLAAKYGLPVLGVPTGLAPSPASTDAKPPDGGASEDTAAGIVKVRLLRKRFAEQDYQNYIWFDIEFTAPGLDKPARAIKGVLHLQDLFGEPKMNLNWTIDEQLAPGVSVTEKGVGFKYNEFMNEHQWVMATDLTNMTASFTVESILFTDGTRKDY